MLNCAGPTGLFIPIVNILDLLILLVLNCACPTGLGILIVNILDLLILLVLNCAGPTGLGIPIPNSRGTTALSRILLNLK